MFSDLLDMTLSYIQYITLLLRLSPDEVPDFFVEPFKVLRYVVLNSYTDLDEGQRYSNPLRVRLPNWLPLDIRLQFVGIAVVGPMILTTIGMLFVYGKLAYLWFVSILATLFCFLFGFILLANLSSFVVPGPGTSLPPQSTLAILGGIGLPLFIVLLAVGLISVGRARLRVLRKDNAELEKLVEEERQRRQAQRVTQQMVDREGIDLVAVAAQRVHAKRDAESIARCDWPDLILQGLFAAVLLIGSLILIGSIPVPAIREMQHSKAFHIAGGVLMAVWACTFAWWVLSFFTAGRKLLYKFSKFTGRRVLGLVVTVCNMLYINVVINFISIIYCVTLVCGVGTRTPHSASLFPPLSSGTTTTEEVVGGSAIGCLACDFQNYTQRCSARLMSEMCNTVVRQPRLVYDPRVQCDSIDGFFKVSGSLIFATYLLFLPYLQFYMAQYGVRVLKESYPLERRYYDVFTPEEIYFQKVLSSQNNAAFAYRAYKPQFRFYRLSFLLQKLVLGVVGCAMRVGLSHNVAWAGMLFFLVIPLIALSCSLVLRPFSRQVEACYFIAVQSMVSVCAAVCLAAQRRGVPDAVWIALLVLLVLVPVCTLVVGNAVTLREERRWAELLQQRLVEGVTAAYTDQQENTKAAAAPPPSSSQRQQQQQQQSSPQALFASATFMRTGPRSHAEELFSSSSYNSGNLPHSAEKRSPVVVARPAAEEEEEEEEEEADKMPHQRVANPLVSAAAAGAAPDGASGAVRRRHRGPSASKSTQPSPSSGSSNSFQDEHPSQAPQPPPSVASRKTRARSPSNSSTLFLPKPSAAAAATAPAATSPTPAATRAFANLQTLRAQPQLMQANTWWGSIKVVLDIAGKTLVAPFIHHSGRVTVESAETAAGEGRDEAGCPTRSGVQPSCSVNQPNQSGGANTATAAGVPPRTWLPRSPQRSGTDPGEDAARGRQETSGLPESGAVCPPQRAAFMPEPQTNATALYAPPDWLHNSSLISPPAAALAARSSVLEIPPAQLLNLLSPYRSTPPQQQQPLASDQRGSLAATLTTATSTNPLVKPTSDTTTLALSPTLRQRRSVTQQPPLPPPASTSIDVYPDSPHRSAAGLQRDATAAFEPPSASASATATTSTGSARNSFTPQMPDFSLTPDRETEDAPPRRAAGLLNSAAAMAPTQSLTVGVESSAAPPPPPAAAAAVFRSSRHASVMVAEERDGEDANKGVICAAANTACGPLSRADFGEYAQDATEAFVPALYFAQRARPAWWFSNAAAPASSSSHQRSGRRGSTANPRGGVVVSPTRESGRRASTSLPSLLSVRVPLLWKGGARRQAQKQHAGTTSATVDNPFSRSVAHARGDDSANGQDVLVTTPLHLSSGSLHAQTVSTKRRRKQQRRHSTLHSEEAENSDDTHSDVAVFPVQYRGAPPPPSSQSCWNAVWGFINGAGTDSVTRSGYVLTFTEVYARRQLCSRLAEKGGGGWLLWSREAASSAPSREAARKAFWGTPTDAMLGVVEVPGSMPPWGLFCHAPPPPPQPLPFSSSSISLTQRTMFSLQRQYYAQLTEETQQRQASAADAKMRRSSKRANSSIIAGSGRGNALPASSLLTNPAFSLPSGVRASLVLPQPPQNPLCVAAEARHAAAVAARRARGVERLLPLDTELDRFGEEEEVEEEDEWGYSNCDSDARRQQRKKGNGGAGDEAADDEAIDGQHQRRYSGTLHWLEQWGPLLTELLYEAATDDGGRNHRQLDVDDDDSTSADSVGGANSSGSGSSSPSKAAVHEQEQQQPQQVASKQKKGWLQRLGLRKTKSDPVVILPAASRSGSDAAGAGAANADPNRFAPPSPTSSACPASPFGSPRSLTLRSHSLRQRRDTAMTGAATASQAGSLAPSAVNSPRVLTRQRSTLLTLITGAGQGLPTRSTAASNAPSMASSWVATTHYDSNGHAAEEQDTGSTSAAAPASSERPSRRRKSAKSAAETEVEHAGPPAALSRVHSKRGRLHSSSSNGSLRKSTSQPPSRSSVSVTRDGPPEGPRLPQHLMQFNDASAVPQDPLIQQLRCLYLVRERLKESYWDHLAQLKAVQKYIDYEINETMQRVLTFLFFVVGTVATISFTLAVLGMLHTLDWRFISGVLKTDNSVAYELAGYADWELFTEMCCCVAATGLDASYPFYAIDVENWICADGVTKERVRRDAYDETVQDGYTVRALCGMEFLNGCSLVVDAATSTVAVVGCNETAVTSDALTRW